MNGDTPKPGGLAAAPADLIAGVLCAGVLNDRLGRQRGIFSSSLRCTCPIMRLIGKAVPETSSRTREEIERYWTR